MKKGSKKSPLLTGELEEGLEEQQSTFADPNCYNDDQQMQRNNMVVMITREELEEGWDADDKVVVVKAVGPLLLLLTKLLQPAGSAAWTENCTKKRRNCTRKR